MTDFEQPALSASHLNNGLFADYYLNEIVPTLPEWSDDLFNEAKAVREILRDLRQRTHPAALDEAQLEEQWVQPVFKALNLHYSVQVKVRYQQTGNRRPDYVFVASEAEARALTNAIYAPEEIAHALAVGDAKRWGTRLDQSGVGQRNSAQQIDEYLRYSELPWGILTDGRFWRLYHRDTSKHNQYYAVDLDALLESDNISAFLYFYAFFRRNAFTSGWLSKVLAGSEDFARKLTDKLEDEVYEALEIMAQGFLDYRRNRLSATPPTLREIYENSLVLLYRLLFIFYAESRQILPIDNAAYKADISMDSIKKEVANTLRFSRNVDPDSSHLYTRLRDLFFAIDAGNPRYAVPPYNGRLFSDSEHPFLEKHIVGDSYLVPALDKLARVDDLENKRGERVFVDYRDLEVRHLGSIYEKLLEYELDIATEALTLKKGQYAPAKSGDADIVKQAGQVYLRTGSNERKVTGSYYTPDYIVRFIVEKTLEPLLTAITARHAEQDADGQWHVRDGEALVREVLALNVLDPATGSGHFVVDVTAYIAEWLAKLSLNPADLGDEDELIYWKRQVASACIYAIDINPLAVELAKLSMWLTTLAKGKPLSFLDHHLRVGNSLVGTDITHLTDDLDEEKRRKKRAKAEEKAAAVGQMSMFSDADFTDGVRFAVEQMNAIEGTIANHVSDVKQQEQLYADLTKRLSTWGQAADVWTARNFGLEITADQWKAVRNFTASSRIPANVQKLVDEAQRIAREQRFFHWELAFPEIFFDVDGKPKANPGFDAVVGNPPYVRQERIQPIKPFLQEHYDVYSGTADLFLYFYERGLNFLKREHRLGYITSGTYMNSNSAKPFRQYIHDKAGMEWVANFGENQPFRGAEMVYPTIAVVRHDKKSDTFRNLFMEGNIPFSQLEESLEAGEWVDSLSDATGMEEWRFQPADLTRLYKKVISDYQTLEKAINGAVYYGIKTGLNEVFIIDDEKRKELIAAHSSSEKLIKPLLRGQDFRPWYQVNSGLYLIFTHSGITNIDEFPAIRTYLEQFRESLEPKPNNWKGTWKGRKQGSYSWFQIQDQVVYYQEFEKDKIYWAEIAKLPRFSWDDQKQYSNNKAHMLIPPSKSFLSILNSRVIWFIISQMAVPLRLRGGLWQYQTTQQFVKRLPIPDLSAQQESDLAAIAEENTSLARSRYALHEDFRRTLVNEFDGDEISTRVGLYKWWEMDDEKALSDELKRQFKQEIPLGKRSEWRKFLAEQKAKHQTLTDDIIAQEIRLNAIVYDAFKLNQEERQLIEDTTKYPYGEV
ncbi:MAG: Eco57I restriction-modification methylase domain-containing protein [Aggregatilineales bacterium]